MDAATAIEIDDVSFDVCPVCDTLVKKETLEHHVEAHFKHQDRNDTTAEQQSSADTIDVRQKLPGPPCKKTCSQSEVLANETSDEMLARVLQEEEKCEIERQKEKEKEEFHKLQHKYGMNSASGYAEQYTQSLDKDVSQNKLSMPEYYSKKEKLLDSLLSGEESVETCTTGVINHLQQQIRTKGPTPNHFVRLCCPTDHFSSSYGDKSWGCGYRNLQMLLSALIKLEHYKGAILKVCQNIPSIPTIQQLIEDAWRHGFDQQGAAQLDHKLTKTKKWIGATEIAVALKFIGLRAHIVDFYQATAADGTHPELFAWMKRYFSKDSAQTPVYIQHQGHSRLVVGFEERYTKVKTQHLILFDPSHPPKKMQELFGGERRQNTGFNMLRKTTKQMKSKQYQLVYVDGIMTEAEKQDSTTLSSVRIP